jgi:uncharacterized membrane protein YedE/YeeE
MTSNQGITLNQFIEQRLGQNKDVGVLLRTMLVRSFGAGSFRDFWRYWNPVYGYWLYRYCYKPLRRMLPRPLCVIVTFACSGFLLHDLPFGWWVRALKTQSLPVPFVATWFVVMAVFMLLADLFKLSVSGLPFAARVAVNSAYIPDLVPVRICALALV